MDKPKVLHVVRPTTGGIGKHILTLVNGIRDFFDVTVACPGSDFPGVELRASGIKTLPLPLAGAISPASDYRVFKTLIKFMAGQGIELVHSHGAKAALVARPAALLAKVPVSIYTVHNSINYGHQPAWKNKIAAIVERILSYPTDCIITVSDALAEEITSGEKIRRDKIMVIRNGIHFDHLLPSPGRDKCKEKWHIEPHRPVVGAVARMAPQKGLGTLVAAAEQLINKQKHDAHFLIAGDGPLMKHLMHQVKSAGLENRFTFTGMVTDITTVYAALDVFVLPSLTEGLPLSLLEAMACSLPVVATPVGGVPEVISHGENGVLVVPGQPEVLALEIASLLDNPDQARQIGARARRDVMTNFGAAKMIESTVKLYRQLLLEKGLSATGDELVWAP